MLRALSHLIAIIPYYYYCIVVYLDESPDVGGQVDRALRVSAAVRVTDMPFAVVRIRRKKHESFRRGRRRLSGHAFL